MSTTIRSRLFLPMLTLVLSPLFAQEDLQSQLGNAVWEGKAEEVKRLIQAGADVNLGSPNDRTTPLSNALRNQHFEIIRILAEAGADVNEEDNRGRSLLMQTVLDKDQAVVETLLELGADPNWIDKDSKDALDYLFSRKQLDHRMVESLLDAGADLNRLRSSGTILQQACSRKDTEMVRKLLDRGADPNLADPLGMTPLFAAVAGREPELVRMLATAGADLNVRVMNMTLAQMAQVNGNHEIVNLLEDLASSQTVSGQSDAGASPADSGKSEAADTTGRQALLDYQSAASQQRSRKDNPSKPKPAPPGLVEYRVPGNSDPSSGGVYISGRPDIREGQRCNARGEIGPSGVETVKGYRLYSEDGHAVGVSGETVYVPPGSYRLVTTTSAQPWKWVCAGVLRSTTGEVTSIWSLRREEGETLHADSWIQIGTETETSDQPGEPEQPKIEILSPESEAELTFDSSEEGLLLILASAEVTPSDLEDQVTWTLEGIGEAEIEISPPKGANVEIRVKALPTRNEDFGEKKLTARIPGAQDETTLKVFFWPTATNHPGEGSGETPNWFYYWTQTTAADQYSSMLRYKANLPAVNRPGDSVLARYDRTDDALYFSDLAYTSRGCTRRAEARVPGGTPAPVGGNATGIDCFGELVLHEARHRFEWHRWWLEGTNQVTRFVHLLAEDGDADYVPTWVEENEPGCSDSNQFSCDNRPRFTSSPVDVPDTELYAYYEGWKWSIGSADPEDWSRCGKQWTSTECER